MRTSPLNAHGGPIVFMGLSDRIAVAIKASGKTKADIARACNVTNAAVTHWLSGGTKSLQAEKAFALAQATGFRADWILHGKGPKLQTEQQELYWPFPKIPLKRFMDLDPDDRGYVQRCVMQAIEKCEIDQSAADQEALEKAVIPTTQDGGRGKKQA